jgi:hypothetical protein
MKIGVPVVLVGLLMAWQWSNMINLIIPYSHRSGKIDFAVETVTDAQFEQIAKGLQSEKINYTGIDPSAQNREVYGQAVKGMVGSIASFQRNTGLDHIERFRRAGIRSYEGPKTCLKCHETIRVKRSDGSYDKVPLADNLMAGVHFTFNHKSGLNTYGFNGKLVKGISLGKIDRACGIPGSFTWTGWAAIIHTKHGDRSEGCGQCHIGGEYGPITGTMMPAYKPTEDEFASVDCLICHAQAYDMNQKYVVKDPNGKFRWNQDRSMKAAMSVTRPTTDTCLRCHQHNMGGDAFAGNEAAKSLGYKNPRILHTGAKRGNPMSTNDVHFRAGVQCLDCHESQGHLIARGKRGTDLVANDLPEADVSCEKCHTNSPHIQNKVERAFLNAHTARMECETCHITHLEQNNVVLRDWTEPVYDEKEGMWTPKDVLRSGDTREAILFRWHNGNGHFMAGALGDNPNGLKLYKSFTIDPDKPFVNFNYDADYEKIFRPIADMGTSKIAPFKRFNARMFEDMGNQGPYGGMLLPFDYNVYYETGDAKKSMEKAVSDPIIKMMYGRMFKYYIMDSFMHYMAIDKGWTIPFSGKVEGKWMRQDATLMLNHGITKEARKCEECHSQKGIMPFERLGYTKARSDELQNLPELKLVRSAEASGKH